MKEKARALISALLSAPLGRVAHAVLRDVDHYVTELDSVLCEAEIECTKLGERVNTLEAYNRKLAGDTNFQAGEIARLRTEAESLKEQLRLAAAGVLPKPDEPLGKIPMIKALRVFVTASDAAKPQLSLKAAKMIADVLNGADGEIVIRCKGWDGQPQEVRVNVAEDIRQLNAAAAASLPKEN